MLTEDPQPGWQNTTQLPISTSLAGGADQVISVGNRQVWGRISGQATDANNNPLMGIPVRAESVLVPGWQSPEALTDLNGEYTIVDLPIGPYRVAFAYGPGIPYVPEWYDNAYAFASGTDVMVLGGQTAPGIDAILQPVSTYMIIEGRVTNTAGQPIEWVEVNAVDRATQTPTHSVITGANGEYLMALGSATTTSCALSFTDLSGVYLPEYYDNQPTLATAAVIAVVPGTTMTVDAVLEGASGTTGSISVLKFEDKDGDGSMSPTGTEFGVPGVTILLYELDPQGAWLLMANDITDAGGLVRFDNLPAGPYRIDEVPQTDWQPTTQLPVQVQVVAGQTTDLVVGNRRIDTMPPVSQLSLSPAEPPSGWWTTDVQATIEATDAAGSSTTSYYSLDGDPPVLYTVPVTLSAEGGHSIEYWSADAAGNVETLSNHAIIAIDKTAPHTASNAQALYSGSAVIELSASDLLSGVSKTVFSLDGGPSVEGTTTPVTVSTGDVGMHTLYFHSEDVAGNVEATQTVDFEVVAQVTDTTRPTTALHLDPGVPGVWTHNDQIAALIGQDEPGGSGLATTYYVLDGGPLALYGAPLLLNTEGIHELDYWSVDVAGNTETPKTAEIWIDKTSPITQHDAQATYLDDATIRLDATDVLSGPSLTRYRLDGGSWVATAPPVDVMVVAPGQHTLEFFSEDLAGNAEAVRTVSFDVVPAQAAVDLQLAASAQAVRPGDLVEYTYRAINTGNVALTDVVVDDDVLGPIGGPVTLPPGGYVTFSAVATLTATTTSNAMVHAESTAGPLSDSASTSVDVINPAIDVAKAVDSTSVSAGGVVTYTYTVSNTGDTVLLNLVATDDRLGQIDVIPLLAPGASWTRSISAVLSVDTTNTVTVDASDGYGGAVHAEDSVFVHVLAATPQISMAPTATDFGVVNPGSSAQSTVTVSNTGTAPLAIGSLLVTPTAQFAVVAPSAPVTLTPGASAAVVVRFTPSVDGTFTAQLGIGSNDPAQPIVAVSLTGVGNTSRINVAAASNGASVRYFTREYVTGPASAAIDGQLAYQTPPTAWLIQSPGAPQWIDLDLGRVRTINSVTVSTEDIYGCGTLRLLTSTNGSTWTQVFGLAGPAATAGRINSKTYTLATPRSTRYLRFHFSNLKSSQWLKVNEVEAYGQ